MCNYIFGPNVKHHHKNNWENKAIIFWNHAYLSHIRKFDCIINSYYSNEGCGSFIRNNGFGYLARGDVNRNIFAKLFDFINGNFIRYITMKQRYNRAAVTVEQMRQYNRTRSRLRQANKLKKVLTLNFKQTEIFSRELRNKVLDKGHKIKLVS